MEIILLGAGVLFVAGLFVPIDNHCGHRMVHETKINTSCPTIPTSVKEKK